MSEKIIVQHEAKISELTFSENQKAFIQSVIMEANLHDRNAVSKAKVRVTVIIQETP